MDQLLHQNAISKKDFEGHVKSVMEYMEMVKKIANMTCEHVKIEMKTLQQQMGMNESRRSKALKKVRKELAKKISEATQQQEALGSGMKADVGKLTTDVLGVISNMDGLTTDANGLKVNMSTLGADLGRVASNMTKLESSIKS